jgi:hypothetical protein
MKQVLKDIAIVIKKHGYFRYNITQDLTPNYSYTIGLTDKVGFELVSGGMNYFEEDNNLQYIFDSIVDGILKNSESRIFDLGKLGIFNLIKADVSWISMMMLGAYDYYNNQKIDAFQIIPSNSDKFTLDIPNMSIKWSLESVIWKHLDDNLNWEYNIPKSSRAITNLAALKGDRLTEFFRYEIDEWEIFAGNGSLEPKESIRIVPISVLIGIDKSIENFINDPIGKGKYRDSSDDSNLTWYNWE